MRNVKITHDTFNTPTVEVDGEDLAPHLRALQLNMTEGDRPLLILEGRPGKFEYEGEARVEIVDPEQQRKLVLDFLENVDSRWLDEAMLNDVTLDVGVGAGALRILVKHAREILG
jgi:hypothetical protein